MLSVTLVPLVFYSEGGEALHKFPRGKWDGPCLETRMETGTGLGQRSQAQGGIVGVNCAGPEVEVDDPCRSHPAQDIL